MVRKDIFDGLSKLICYPSEDYHKLLNEFRISLSNLKSENDTEQSFHLSYENIKKINATFELFNSSVINLSREELEELYTQTFDINPVSSLEIGWHLFGETYERGSFLVKMRETLRELAVEESAELPDHITHVLLALGRMDKAEQTEFSEMFFVPALNKILTAFEGKNNPYENLLKIIGMLIKVNQTLELGVN
jgi:nitrate reductase delta subunit